MERPTGWTRRRRSFWRWPSGLDCSRKKDEPYWGDICGSVSIDFIPYPLKGCEALWAIRWSTSARKAENLSSSISMMACWMMIYSISWSIAVSGATCLAVLSRKSSLGGTSFTITSFLLGLTNLTGRWVWVISSYLQQFYEGIVVSITLILFCK